MGGIHGVSKSQLLDGIYSPIDDFWEANPLCPSMVELLTSENYKIKKASEIRASGYVMHTLEAVLWAFLIPIHSSLGLYLQ